jgi:hypothetical protein
MDVEVVERPMMLIDVAITPDACLLLLPVSNAVEVSPSHAFSLGGVKGGVKGGSRGLRLSPPETVSQNSLTETVPELPN